MTEIRDFLLARYAEDEAVAREVMESNVRLFSVLVADGDPTAGSQLEEANQGAEYMVGARPSRVLAECDAKRQIVENHAPALDDHLNGWIPGCRTCGSLIDDELPDVCFTLRSLALPYADHPDYDPVWRR